MKILELLAQVFGPFFFILGLGVTFIFSVISFNQKDLQIIALFVGVVLMAVGWLILSYRAKSKGLSILDLLIQLI